MNENMNNNPMEVMEKDVNNEWKFDWKSGLIGAGCVIVAEGVVFCGKLAAKEIGRRFFKKNDVNTTVEVEDDEFDDDFEDDKDDAQAK